MREVTTTAILGALAPALLAGCGGSGAKVGNRPGGTIAFSASPLEPGDAAAASTICTRCGRMGHTSGA